MFLFKRYVIPAAIGLTCLGWCASALGAPMEDRQGIGPQSLEALARQDWQETMILSEATQAGCSEAEYPSTVWVKVECPAGTSGTKRLPPKPAASGMSIAAPQVVGGAYGDYAIQGNGRIQQTIGNFPTVSNLTSESSVSTGLGGILGSNDYTLQINSNSNSTSPPAGTCPIHSTTCSVWQQFVYATDFSTGTASLYIEYWINGSTGNCPYGFGTGAQGGCVYDSPHMPVPNEPITQLPNMLLAGMTGASTPTSAAWDRITFIGGGKVWTQVVPSALGLANWWNQSEFNVFGDGFDSEAVFNNGASVTVAVAVIDGTSDLPYCMHFGGSTGETNSLNLGPCTTTLDPWPTIEFTETSPAFRIYPPIVIH